MSLNALRSKLSRNALSGSRPSRSVFATRTTFARSQPIFMLRAGEKIREAAGRGRSGTEDGPLHDLHDFHFTDGTAPAETEKQKWWKNKREKEAARVARLHGEMVALHKEWEEIDNIGTQQQLTSKDTPAASV